MTEEELLAEEWCLNHTFADTDSAEGIRLQNAYIAGAEPREKRIADLEKKNAELKNRNAELKGMYAHSAREAGTYKQFFEQKEKENAELKEANTTLATMNDSMWVELEKKRAESQGITNRLHQLTKAKRLLKILIEDYVSEPEVFSDGSCEDNKLCNLIKEAEQFLKESE